MTNSQASPALQATPAVSQAPSATTTPSSSPSASIAPTTSPESQVTTSATRAIITTAKGKMTIELYPSETPITVKNFVEKARSGYYNNLTFHRVESWVIQGGDPLGNGTGGGKMPTELSSRPFEIGSVGVARGGDIKVSNDSQFFICTDDCSWLTGQYTNFGKVISGFEVAKKIEIGEKIQAIEIVPETSKK